MTRRIIVGVDGSDESKAALRWAYEEAKLSGAFLDVLYAWTPPALGDIAGMATANTAPYGLSASELLSSVVDETLGDALDVALHQTVIVGGAAPSLLDASRSADLLVVGSRGRGSLAGALLGSVSRQCADHAPCPVAVIRGR